MHVVIIGGNYAGAKAANILIRESKIELELTIISASNTCYYNVASPRLVTKPEMADTTLFPLEEILDKKNNLVKYEIVIGKAVSVNFSSKHVYIQHNSAEKEIKYDYLILATGSRSKTNIFKLYDTSADELKQSLLEYNNKIKDSKNIMIIGGGATGVELAAELAYKYSTDKSITLCTGTQGTLHEYERITKDATKKLKEANVSVLTDKSTSTEKKGTKVLVSFQNTQTQEVDLVIDTTGTIPNSDFLPQSVLDDKGYVVTNKNLQLKDHPEIFALGDIVSGRSGTIFDLVRSQEAVFKAALTHFILGQQNTLLYLSEPKEGILVPITENGGVGILFGFKIPSFLVRFFKSKDYMIPKAKNFYV